MVGVQEICDRTALATGTGLGEVAVKRFHRAGRAILAVLLVALIVANALNIAADLVAIGSGMQLLHAGPTWLWALLAGALITTLLVLGSFARIALVFKGLCAALLAYLVVAVLVTHQWGSVLTHTIVPHLEFNKAYLALLVAVLGTTISPYLFFGRALTAWKRCATTPRAARRHNLSNCNNLIRPNANSPPAASMCLPG
jgi:Mn2+/Fe2+ NRAMP family transporter